MPTGDPATEAATAAGQPGQRGPDTLLLEFIGRGGARCPVCGYALDGLREPRCPECGEPLLLAIRGESMRRSAWIVGLIAWSMGFGLFGFFVPLTWLLGMGPPVSMWAFYVGALVTWPGLALWMATARRFRLLPPSRRKWLAALSIAIVLGFFVLAGIQVR